VDYADYPAVEWTVWFKNTGTANTPILAAAVPLLRKVPIPVADVAGVLSTVL
jgi:hypothetical protein